MLRPTMLLLVIAACDASADPTTTEPQVVVPKTLRIQTLDNALLKVDVLYNGKTKWFVSDSIGYDGQIVEFEDAVDAPKVELRYTTPCGTKKVPFHVIAVEPKGDKVIMKIGADENPPAPIEVWSDTDSTITFGKATLKHGSGSLRDLGCAKSHEVTIGGKTRTVESAGTGDAIFIPANPSECFTYAKVAYGHTDEGPSERDWRGKTAYRFSGNIDLFMKDADERETLRRGEIGKVLTQIQKVDCDPDAPKPVSWD